ncbi:MAG: nuclear transport factor 2 family protein [Planctomycetes bacterium]|nr:nuclear transport factor 2 family protein [Planctomycetota bacterium]
MSGFVVCFVAMFTGQVFDSATEKKAIQKVLDDQAAAWNKGDLRGFMAGYWESPDLSFYSGNNKTKGWQATLERYQKTYQGEGKEMGKLSFSEMSIDLLNGEHALVKGRFTLELQKKGPTGIFTLILKKVPAGWRIIHDHTST